METDSSNLFRLFSVRCSRDRLISLSGWLNDNLDFAHGEDFDKVSEQPLDCMTDVSLCKTTRRDIVTYIRWAADLISGMDGLKPKDVNRVRIIRELAKKVERTLTEDGNG